MKTIIILSVILFSINTYGQKAQQPQKDTSMYYLLGSRVDFENLLLAIRHPQYIRPVEDTSLVNWIMSAQRTQIQKPKEDSTTKKRK